MKNQLFALFFITISILSSCDKASQSGTVRFTCTSNNPYKLWIDGSYKTEVPGHSYVEYKLSEGSHSANVEQSSGFVLYPTKRSTTLHVYGGKESEWVFP